MIDTGLIEEVKRLLNEDKPLSKQARCAIGYAEIIRFLDGQIDQQEAIELIKKNSRKFAKNQRTWFKTFKKVKWIDVGPEESCEHIVKCAESILKEHR